MVKKLTQIITEGEALKPFQQTWNPGHCMQFKLMFYCGLRVAEMLALTVDNIDLKQQLLKVVSGKGSKDRLVPIPLPMVQALKEYIGNSGIKEGRLFTTSPRNTEKILERISLKVLGKKIHPHTLRHAYGTLVYEKTHDIHLVQGLLGHTSIATTQIYTHLSTDYKKKGIKDVWG